MPENRAKSDSYLKSIGPRPLTDEEHRRYVKLCIEEGSLGTGEEMQDHILASLARDRQNAKAKSTPHGSDPEPH